MTIEQVGEEFRQYTIAGDLRTSFPASPLVRIAFQTLQHHLALLLGSFL